MYCKGVSHHPTLFLNSECPGLNCSLTFIGGSSYDGKDKRVSLTRHPPTIDGAKREGEKGGGGHPPRPSPLVIAITIEIADNSRDGERGCESLI